VLREELAKLIVVPLGVAFDAWAREGQGKRIHHHDGQTVGIGGRPCLGRNDPRSQKGDGRSEHTGEFPKYATLHR